ncbi:hypothetical protein L1987_80208 [Smallanthus sonchifolius]|uniref:Uncharacterized protein n=1 Tax=Smallanthus sonchifolius TaxID=185202 RepID=A0ACB8YNK9_9ASTR|nr:hypothetical protein L1987_80208 [Smallanthus sonchifolius]
MHGLRGRRAGWSPKDLDASELERLFAAVPQRAAPIEPKPKKVHLIDARRASNAEIMLTKVKMPRLDMVFNDNNFDLHDAVLAMDDTLLDADLVENILKFFPSKEEMEQLKNYTGDTEKLDKCEQYFLELMKVPRMEAKLNIFLFKIQFNSQALKEFIGHAEAEETSLNTSQILHNFVKLFLKCYEENLKQAELERKKDEMEAEMEQDGEKCWRLIRIIGTDE